MDVLLLDLEDSVALDNKDMARQQVVDAVKAGGFGYREVVVRINGLDTAWGEADLDAVARVQPDAVLVPKVDCAEDVYAVGRRLNDAGADQALKIWAMMETPGGMLRAAEITASTQEFNGRRLSCLVMGTNDLAKETRAAMLPGRAPMMPWLMTCLAAARAYDLDIIDGVYNQFNDAEGLTQNVCKEPRWAWMARPSFTQTNRSGQSHFSPSSEEIESCREIIEAFERAGKSV